MRGKETGPGRQQPDNRLQSTAEFLQKVAGLSPQFPERLVRLHETLKQGVPRIIENSFELPPQINRTIATSIEYNSGLHIRFDANFGVKGLRNVEFIIAASKPSAGLDLLVTIEDIQNFVRSTFPDRQAILSERPSEFAEPPYRQFEIKLARQKNPLFLFELAEAGDGKTACHLLRFYYKDSPTKVEMIIDRVIKLFEKPLSHPLAVRKTGIKGALGGFFGQWLNRLLISHNT